MVNALTLGLLALALVSTSAFYREREHSNESAELRAHGTATLGMLATVARGGFGEAQRAQFERVLDSLAAVAAFKDAKNVLDVALPRKTSGSCPRP